MDAANNIDISLRIGFSCIYYFMNYVLYPLYLMKVDGVKLVNFGGIDKKLIKCYKINYLTIEIYL